MPKSPQISLSQDYVLVIDSETDSPVNIDPTEQKDFPQNKNPEPALDAQAELKLARKEIQSLKAELTKEQDFHERTIILNQKLTESLSLKETRIAELETALQVMRDAKSSAVLTKAGSYKQALEKNITQILPQTPAIKDFGRS